jgi:hypothetical protein
MAGTATVTNLAVGPSGESGLRAPAVPSVMSCRWRIRPSASRTECLADVLEQEHKVQIVSRTLLELWYQVQVELLGLG